MQSLGQFCIVSPAQGLHDPSLLHPCGCVVGVVPPVQHGSFATLPMLGLPSGPSMHLSPGLFLEHCPIAVPSLHGPCDPLYTHLFLTQSKFAPCTVTHSIIPVQRARFPLTSH